MSYDTVKNMIAGILNGLGYAESTALEFAGASVSEFGNTYILKCLSGEMGDNSETLSDRFYDNQSWQVQLAFDKSEQSELINYDNVHRKKDLIIKAIDKPANWENSVRIQKYKSWNILDEKNYYVLTIEIRIIDTYIY